MQVSVLDTHSGGAIGAVGGFVENVTVDKAQST